MLKYVKMPRSVAEFSLMKGVTDYTNLKQFDMFETGYSLLTVVSVPKFMKVLAQKDDNVRLLQDDFIRIVEGEFRGLSGLNDITTTPSEITNNITSMGLINKVEYDTSVQCETTYYERSGSLLTKYLDVYLTGVKDPYTQAKTYHGLIGQEIYDPGPDYEVFTLLYTVLDNTMRRVEQAYLLCNAQPLAVPYSTIHNSQKGDITFPEIGITWNCFPIHNDQVNKYAAMLLANDLTVGLDANDTSGRALILDSNNFGWNAFSSRVESAEGGGLQSTIFTNSSLASAVDSAQSSTQNIVTSAVPTFTGV